MIWKISGEESRGLLCSLLLAVGVSVLLLLSRDEVKKYTDPIKGMVIATPPNTNNRSRIFCLFKVKKLMAHIAPTIRAYV